MGKTSDGSQVLHVQAEKADDLDLSDLFPDAHVVSDSEISSKLHTKTIVEFLLANGHNNFQNCWASNVGSCCVRCSSGVQRDAITPNSVGTSSASWDGLEKGCIIV